MINKRGKVYWYNFRWQVKHNDGSVENFRIRQSAKTTNKSEATDAEHEHRRAIRLGEVHPADPWPKPAVNAPCAFRAFSKEFLEYAKTHTKPGTHTFYGVCMERLLTFAAIADAPLNEITGELASRYARYRRAVPRNSVVTVNGDLRTLRRALNLAVEWGRLEHGPTIHEMPQSKGRERVIDFAEEARYLAMASENLRDAAILAADTGMRPNSELFPLRWVDVDLKASAECPNGAIHVRRGKTDNAQRSLLLTPRAAGVLQRRKAARDVKTNHSPFVFAGGGMSGHVTSMQHPHKKAVEAAGLKSFEFYCWRHTFGTRAAQSGMDRYTLARFMGHSSPAVAARYYIHVTETHVAEGFGRFVEYQARNVEEGMRKAFSPATDAAQ